MKEKVMVSDALNAINSSLSSLGSMIPQTENPQLRLVLQQMRNSAEQSQLDLYNIARERQYYVPAKQASDSQINEMKTMLGTMKADTNKAML